MVLPQNPNQMKASFALNKQEWGPSMFFNNKVNPNNLDRFQLVGRNKVKDGKSNWLGMYPWARTWEGKP